MVVLVILAMLGLDLVIIVTFGGGWLVHTVINGTPPPPCENNGKPTENDRNNASL